MKKPGGFQPDLVRSDVKLRKHFLNLGPRFASLSLSPGLPHSLGERGGTFAHLLPHSQCKLQSSCLWQRIRSRHCRLHTGGIQ